MGFDRRLMALARQSRLTIILTIVLGALTGILTVTQSHLLTQAVGQVFLQGKAPADVSRFLLLLLGTFVLRSLLAWASEISGNASAQKVKTSLRRLLYRKLIDLGPAYLGSERDARTGELVSTAVDGIETLDAYFSQYLPQVVLAAVVPFTFFLFVLPVDLLSALVLLLTAPLIPVFMVLIGSLAKTLTRRQFQTLNRMSAYFLDVLQGLTALKTLGRSKEQAGVIEQVSERFRTTTMGVLRVTFLSALVLEMVSTISTAVVAVEIGLRLLYGRLAFEQAFFVLLLAPEFYLPLRLLGTRFHAGMSGVTAAKRIFEILDRPLPGEDRDPVKEEAGEVQDRGEENLQPGIHFRRVEFAYADGRKALQGVSFDILPGQTVALVGPSGAGKSTIAGLLLRFLPQQSGQIFINGAPLEGLPAADWRRQIAWVPQRPYLFQDTVLENIRLARPEASLHEVIEAARLAHADEFISELPQGYYTPIGERGARLSGGQAQRIALARAFLKNAPLLILDEATSSLDPENESLVQDALERLLKGRTALVIAHRLSTVARADQIIVLNAGQIVESGTHDELLARNGFYARLVGAFSGSVHRTAASEMHSEVRTPASFSKQAAVASRNGSSRGASAKDAAPLQAAGRFHALKQLLKLAAPLKKWIALSTLLGFATIGSSIGLMTTSAYIISAAALQPSIALLQVPIVGVRFFGISRGVFRYLERLVSHEVTFRLLARLRVWFYQALEPLAPARLLRYHSGDLLSRIVGDIETLENFYVRVLAPPLAAALVALAACIYLGSFHPSLALVLLVFLLLAGLVVPLIARMLGRKPGQELNERRAALSSALVDGVQGLPDLLAFGQEERQMQHVETAHQELSRAQTHMAWVNGFQTALFQLCMNLGFWSVLALAVPLVHSGQIQGVYLAGLVLAALTSFEAVQPLPLAAQYLENNLQAARRLFEVVDVEPEVLDIENPLPLPGRDRFGLQVRSLSFRYPPIDDRAARDDQPYILSDITFELEPGKRLAVVGPSGSGKTTLVNLLLRFWECSEGEILLDGHPLRSYAASDIQKTVGVVSQHTYLFNASIRENLLLARPGASEEEIVRAAQQAQIHDFILSLPEGYDTWIGEQGLRLSGGERQRIAIARALLKDPPLLILDEASAHLDALTEGQVMQAIQTLMQGRTTLMITHRLNMLQDMDEILVLQQGRIIERGRHEELLAQRGLYHHMWELQHQELREILA